MTHQLIIFAIFIVMVNRWKIQLSLLLLIFSASGCMTQKATLSVVQAPITTFADWQLKSSSEFFKAYGSQAGDVMVYHGLKRLGSSADELHSAFDALVKHRLVSVLNESKNQPCELASECQTRYAMGRNKNDDWRRLEAYFTDDATVFLDIDSNIDAISYAELQKVVASMIGQYDK